jgi:hypothetical protein
MKVIQRDEIGKGLLIEHDGWILKEDNEGFLNEMHKLEIGDKNISDPLYVYAVLQKYDTENKNGRWYPKEILYRENERYQSLIKTRSSIGELNHPDCVDKNHEILTINGWVSIVDVKEGDMVLTFNTETETSEYQPVKRKIEQFYEGFMYEIKGKMLEKTVTPNHRFLMEDRHKKGYFYETIQEIVDNPINRMVVKKSVFDDSNFRDDEYITLKGVESKVRNNFLKKKYSEDLKIKSEDWFAFLGIFLSDGYSTGCNSGIFKSNRIAVTQKEGEKSEKIHNLFKKLPFDFRIHKRCGDKLDFIISDARLFNVLTPLGNSAKKYIPEEYKNWKNKYSTILIDWFHLGDGTTIKDKNGKIVRKVIFSTSKRLIDDLQQLTIQCGYYTSLVENTPVDRIINDVFYEEVDDDGVLTIKEIKKPRLIKTKTPIFCLNFIKTKNTYIRYSDIKKIYHKDMVYCVEVDNSNFYIRKNGKSCFTGNSSNISLKPTDASHIIVETFWKGKTLLGKLEILTSPGFIKNGIISCSGDFVANLLRKNILIGVSSRGVGSLKKEGNKNLVQDDFELVCWDIVAQPSTPGSYIFTDMERATKLWVEEEDKEQNLENKRMESMKRFLGF